LVTTPRNHSSRFGHSNSQQQLLHELKGLH
jgi:hypothetical protein